MENDIIENFLILISRQKQDQKSTRCDISKPDIAKPDTTKHDTAKPDVS